MPTVKEYSGFIQLIRDYNKSLPLEQAVDMAVKEAGNWQCLGRFLQKHRSEVVSVVLMEYDEKLQEGYFYNKISDPTIRAYT